MSMNKYVAAAAVGIAGVGVMRKAGEVKRQNSPFRRYWERHLQATLADLDERAAAGQELPLVYVALGDSAAQGLGATEIEEGYVPRVAQALAQGSGREVALLNLSLSGGMVQSVLGTQLPQLAGLRIGGKPIIPDVVTLDIGGNDVRQPWLTEDIFARDYARLVDELPAGTFVMNVPSYGKLPEEEKAAAFCATVDRHVAGSHHHLVDIGNYSRNLPWRTYTFDYHASDLFHPNSAWYEVWAQQFVNQICAVHGWPQIAVAELEAWSGPIAEVVFT
ncbi:SGNH/GDSL hydrolase family protein [Trueperella bialowiezensis]|uniref:GDSL-like Lipase/Acylhydrolase n=1 Tax=Trueperella bialowiezensis TaxID=312285 RepID=A0A3S4WHL5_9ACTO|nr:GDSL-type esterase/lipase family protein [Trueperella bialowiezensis]VEI14131.1 GDSL-like Lipase/Acylhydrolase [Trueperella bialowiezensis]